MQFKRLKTLISKDKTLVKKTGKRRRKRRGEGKERGGGGGGRRRGEGTRK